MDSLLSQVRQLLLFGLGLLGLVAGTIESPRASGAEPVSSLKELYALTTEQSREGRPARFKGVVVCYDLAWGQLYVHDGNAVVWFNPRGIATELTKGQRVEITGNTTVDGGANALTNLTVEIAGSAPLPQAKRLSLTGLHSDLGQWVETRGIVRVVDFSWGRPAIVLQEAGQSCLAYVMGAAESELLKKLVGSTIQIRGINASKVAEGKLASASVFVPGISEITILEQAVARVEPKAESIEGVLSRELGDWTNAPVRIVGFVVAYDPGKSIVIKDPTGVVRAQLVQTTQVKIGERVDLRGFLQLTPDEAVLGDAYFEVVRVPIQDPDPSGPVEVSASEVKAHEPLTQVGDVLRLKSKEAAQRIPVRLSGVITYSDHEWQNGFLQDSTGGIFLNLADESVLPGHWVQVTGETGPGGFAPEILKPVVEILGKTNFPAPARVDLGDLANGHFDARWIEIEGVVRRVHLEWGHLTIQLMSSYGKFTAIVPRFYDQATPTHLIDSRVRVQGACGSQLNARRQLSGITLHVPSLAQIETLELSRADPFTTATLPIGRIGTFDPDHPPGRRVKVHGVVTLSTRDQGFFLQDNSGGIRVAAPPGTNGVVAGDVVEVLGFPVLGEYAPVLEEAIFRKTGTAPLPEAQLTTAEQILMRGTNHGQIVTLHARVLKNVGRAAKPQIVLQDESVIFPARLETFRGGRELPNLRSGSLLRVTGVCSVNGGDQNEAKSFRLLLRSPSDVVLVARPAWWSARQILWTFGGLAALLLITMAWGWTLRKQVLWQTRKLREEIAERERMGLQVEKTHKELLAASRQAGMAEVATSVLHNVGNVLNSVNVSATLVSDQLRKSKSSMVGKSAALLNEHAADLGTFLTEDPKGRQLPTYLRQLGEHLSKEQKEAVAELESLRKNIDHIKDIVAMQQSYARMSGIVESVNLAQLIEDALRINGAALQRHGVQVERNFEPTPAVTIDKHKLLQIMVNLIRNAKYACDESARPDKRLSVSLSQVAQRIRIVVADNGVGIPRENLPRIFNHGFTTRKDGHGFGLHSGALAAKEMGGSLGVHSDGPGQGATFTLELPVNSEQSRAHE